MVVNASNAGLYAGTITDGLSNNVLRLTKEGSGTLTMTGANTYTGATNISGGELELGGSGSINDSSEITIEGGSLLQNSSVDLTSQIAWLEGTVGGSGVIDGNLSATGTGAKVLSPGSSTGTLTITGDVLLDSNTTFLVEINGTGAGTDYDVLHVGGLLNLNDAEISVVTGFTPLLDDEFTILFSDDAVTGIFNGLEDGTVFSAGSTQFRINYSSSDVTLTAVPEVKHISLIIAVIVLFLPIYKRVRSGSAS